MAITAPWVARDVETPRGRRRAIIWNLFGIADLIVAVGLGIMTSPGRRTFSRLHRGAAYFIPTVLVPLLLMTHALVFPILLRPESVEIQHA